jgi:hypothetical protein
VVSFEHVFTEPPRRKLDAEIKKRHEEAVSLRAEVQALRSEKAEMERARVTSLKEMSKNAALARIEDFLAGRFTYFVEVPSWGCPSIKTKEALLKGGGVHEYDRETKLLTLFGKSNGDLQWGVSRYYDGSGGVTEVFPVEDEAEGLVMIRTFYAGHVAAWRSDPKKHTAVTWSHGLPTGTVDVPADLAFFIKDQERKSLEEREAKALADLCAIRSKIADAAK